MPLTIFDARTDLPFTFRPLTLPYTGHYAIGVPESRFLKTRKNEKNLIFENLALRHSDDLMTMQGLDCGP